MRLMRPVNCVMMGFAVLVGAVLAEPQPQSLDWLRLLYGFLTGFSLTAASMAVNDYYDRVIDAINEPSRPIPSGLVRPREALAFSLALSAVGLGFSYLSGPICLVVAVFAWAIMLAYVTAGKRSGFPGNLLVSTCVSIPFVYGCLIAVGRLPLSVMFFTLMVFLSNTGREVTKGIVDVRGDAAEGVKTLAVVYGERVAAFAAAVFYLLAVSLTPIPWLLGIVSFWYLPFVLAADAGFVSSSVLLLRDYSRESARRVKRLVLAWFTLGFVSFILGVLG